MKKRALSIFLAAMMAGGMIMGCTASAEEGEKTKISVYLGGDAAEENQIIIETFNAQSETVEAELVTLTEGSSGYEMLTVMYNAGNPPAVYFLEAGDILKLTDKLGNVADLECAQYANAGTTEDITVDETLYGVPGNIQAYGLIYNEKVLKDVMGEDFDPQSIKTKDEFKAVCDKVQEAGIAPVAISPFDWNLGNHWFTQIYTGQADNKADRDAFVAELKAGTADLAANEVFNDYMDTFDMMMEYNYYKENPLETVADGNDKQAQLLALEQAAFWFHGNWATANIRTLDEEGTYGFIPVPVNETNPNYGKICTLVPGYFCVEQSIATEEQQAAAREFISWLIMSEEGQQYVVNCGNIPAYSNNDAEITESVSTSVVAYAAEENTFPMYVMFPSDHYKYVGGSMQKYLSGEIDRAGLAQEITDYWVSQN